MRFEGREDCGFPDFFDMYGILKLCLEFKLKDSKKRVFFWTLMPYTPSLKT